MEIRQGCGGLEQIYAVYVMYFFYYLLMYL